MKLIDLLGKKGKHIDIIPQDSEIKVTEIYNKKFEYLGKLAFDNRKRWNCFVLIELDPQMMMSKDCIDEAFTLTEEYWNNKKVEQ